MESLESVLKSRGLKCTQPRLTILQALESKHCPLSAEDIFERCKGGRLDLVTVYRNLRTFEDKTIVRRSSLGDGIDRYELSIDDHHHHHLVCRNCKVIQKLPDCNLRSLEKFAKDRGFSALSHHLEIFGLCSRCGKA